MIRHFTHLLFLLFLLPCLAFPLHAQQAAIPADISAPNEEEIIRYASIRHEIARAIEKGNAYLQSKQSPKGIWGDDSYPAMTALACTAAMRSPDLAGKPIPASLEKAYRFILDSQKEDGSIYNKGLASYNTSVCMMALMAAPGNTYDKAILKARAYLVSQQTHFAPDSPYTGGIGYGGADAPPVADLSNTTLALEAIKYSAKLAKDSRHGPQPDLDWQAAIDFISRCQQPESTPDANDRGGFRYRPQQPEPLPEAGKEPRRSSRGPQEPGNAYGSMTYAGLQSLIYANLGKDDPRVKAALAWLASHYTVDENPGIGIDGLYYYYQAMAKALSAAGIDRLPLKDGSSIDWRQNLAAKIVSLQQADGSWVNTSNRWWEKDPILVTAYCVLALEQIYNSIPSRQHAPNS